jgi:hypothetical protein
VSIGQLDNELGLTFNGMDFSDNFQWLTIEGVMGDADLNALYVRMMQYLVLLVGVNRTERSAAPRQVRKE